LISNPLVCSAEGYRYVRLVKLFIVASGSA